MSAKIKHTIVYTDYMVSIYTIDLSINRTMILNYSSVIIYYY